MHASAWRVAASLAVMAALVASAASRAADATIDAPNVVPISAQIVTSGQPTAKALSSLASQGFGAVIYLAPFTVQGAVPDEAEIVRRQGVEFVNIPIPFERPSDSDFQSFVAAMDKLRDRKVLVHCQVNMRASSMTFLYRVIALHEKPEAAYADVARVWSPHGPWKDLIVSQLKKADIRFEPY